MTTRLFSLVVVLVTLTVQGASTNTISSYPKVGALATNDLITVSIATNGNPTGFFLGNITYSNLFGQLHNQFEDRGTFTNSTTTYSRYLVNSTSAGDAQSRLGISQQTPPASPNSPVSTNMIPPFGSRSWKMGPYPYYSGTARQSSDGLSWWLNEDDTCADGTQAWVAYNYNVGIPRGATAFTFSLSAKASRSGTWYVGIFSVEQSLQIAMTNFNIPSATWTNLSITVPYFTNAVQLTLQTTAGGGGPLLVSNANLTFSGSLTNSAFTSSSGFKRYEVTTPYVQGGCLNFNGWEHTPQAQVSFNTAASDITLEFALSWRAAHLAMISAVYTNGVLYGLFTPEDPPAPNVLTAIIPQYFDVRGMSGNTRVDVVSSIAQQDPPAVNQLRSVLVPGSAGLVFLNYNPPRRALVLGDSIHAGVYQQDNSPANSIWPLVQLYSGGTVQQFNYSSGYRELSTYWPNYKTNALYAIQTARPTDVWIALGVNDWQGAQSVFPTTNAFASYYRDMVTSIHGIAPSAIVYAQTMIPDNYNPGFGLNGSGVATNGNGNTLDDFRRAVTNACTGLPYVQFVTGSNLLTGALLAGDNIHPSGIGCERMANLICRTLEDTRNLYGLTNILGLTTNYAIPGGQTLYITNGIVYKVQ